MGRFDCLQTPERTAEVHKRHEKLLTALTERVWKDLFRNEVWVEGISRFGLPPGLQGMTRGDLMMNLVLRRSNFWLAPIFALLEVVRDCTKLTSSQAA